MVDFEFFRRISRYETFLHSVAPQGDRKTRTLLFPRRCYKQKRTDTVGGGADLNLIDNQLCGPLGFSDKSRRQQRTCLAQSLIPHLLADH